MAPEGEGVDELGSALSVRVAMSMHSGSCERLERLLLEPCHLLSALSLATSIQSRSKD